MSGPPDEARGPEPISEHDERIVRMMWPMDGQSWPVPGLLAEIDRLRAAIPAPVAGEHPVVRRGDDLVCLSCGARSYEPVAEPSDAD